MRFFKWVWQKIKQLFATIKRRTFLFFGFVFSWVVPIYLLNESIGLTKTVHNGLKLSFVGVCVAVFVLLKWYGKIKAKINAIEPKTKKMLALQLILITLQKTLTLTAVAFLIYYLDKFIGTFNEWYFVSLIPIGIGIICYSIDRVIMFKKKKAEALAKIESFKEKIKAEIVNG